MVCTACVVWMPGEVMVTTGRVASSSTSTALLLPVLPPASKVWATMLWMPSPVSGTRPDQLPLVFRPVVAAAVVLPSTKKDTLVPRFRSVTWPVSTALALTSGTEVSMAMTGAVWSRMTVSVLDVPVLTRLSSVFTRMVWAPSPTSVCWDVNA